MACLSGSGDIRCRVGVVGVRSLVANWWVGTATQACNVIDALSEERPLLVSEAMQAAHVSLWLRPERAYG
jgi:nucleotide-binding universal stress UspA family protein